MVNANPPEKVRQDGDVVARRANIQEYSVDIASAKCNYAKSHSHLRLTCQDLIALLSLFHSSASSSLKLLSEKMPKSFFLPYLGMQF